jgi:hypothetical protein
MALVMSGVTIHALPGNGRIRINDAVWARVASPLAAGDDDLNT